MEITMNQVFLKKAERIAIEAEQVEQFVRMSGDEPTPGPHDSLARLIEANRFTLVHIGKDVKAKNGVHRRIRVVSQRINATNSETVLV